MGFQAVMKPKGAVVVGGGSMGLETAENLVHRGFDVTVEMLDQVLARIVEGYVETHHIRLALNDGVAGFKQTASSSLGVFTKSGKTHPADIEVIALGVRQETELTKAAGLTIGARITRRSTSTRTHTQATIRVSGIHRSLVGQRQDMVRDQ